MSDENLFEVFEGGDDNFDDYETEDGEIRGEVEGEEQNNFFKYAVIGLGALLVLAIAFFAVWAFVLQPRMGNRVSDAAMTPEPTEEVVDVVVDLDATATAEAEAAATEEPVETEEPDPTATPTPVVKTSTPEPEDDGADDGDTDGDDSSASGDDDANSSTDIEAATEEPRRTDTPTPTPQPTSTPKPESADSDDADTSMGVGSGDEALANTGLGEVLLVVAGLALIGVAFMARKLRNA